MESEIEQTHIDSEYFDKEKFKKQVEIIKKASELAQDKIDYYSAHDDNIIRAIDVVEEFLRSKHRLCYGGQAVNAHLPAKYKFYDPEHSIPDYDFFTPQQDSDILTLVRDLKKAGFTEISVREGMHEGTIKIYVDFIPVADITTIDPKLYKILSKREFRLDGISYLDANALRMLMYLELSRPRGEVRRWPKVFERLSLFNEFVPTKPCKISRNAFHGRLSKEGVQTTINYIIENKRIFAGADLMQFYDHTLKLGEQNTNWILTSKKPIIFFSPDSNNDAKQLKSEFTFMRKQSKDKTSTLKNSNNLKNDNIEAQITIKTFSSKGVGLIPSIRVLSHGKKALVFIIDQTACHSYFNVPINDGKILRIASMDTLITLYFGLGLLDSTFFDMGSMECLANKLVDISFKAREKPDDFSFPFISIKCAGYQTTLPSLIRAKVKRITTKKKNITQLLKLTTKNKATTVKLNRRRIIV